MSSPEVEDRAVATLASTHISDGKVERCTLEISLPWDILVLRLQVVNPVLEPAL